MNNSKTLSTLTNAKVELGANYLSVTEEMSEAELSNVFGALSKMQGSTMFWIGDFLNAVEAKKGEAYAKVYTETEFSPQTLWHAKSVCKKLPRDLRVNLPYSHHKEALVETKGNATLALEYLKQAEAAQMTVKTLRQTIRLALAEHTPNPEIDTVVTVDNQFLAVMDSFGVIRRFLENTDSTTFAIKKGYVLAEVETLHELATKVCA